MKREMPVFVAAAMLLTAAGNAGALQQNDTDGSKTLTGNSGTVVSSTAPSGYISDSRASATSNSASNYYSDAPSGISPALNKNLAGISKKVDRGSAVGGTVPVPEPGTLAMLGVGTLGLALYGKRRRNNKDK